MDSNLKKGKRANLIGPGKIDDLWSKINFCLNGVNALCNLTVRIDPKATYASFEVSSMNAVLVLPGTFINGGNQGGGSLLWQNPKELDPTVAVPKFTRVYISPNNTLVTTGLTDLVSNVVTTAPPGIWETVQNVPAKSGGKYNVPQIPYPGATGTPSGSPLKGDLDGVNVFWAFIQEYSICG